MFDQVGTKLQLGGRHLKEFKRAASPQEFFAAVEEASIVAVIGGNV
jgi:hypothetical protein